MAYSGKWMSSAAIMFAALSACAVQDFPEIERPPVTSQPAPSPAPPPVKTPDEIATPAPQIKVPAFVPSGDSQLDSWRSRFAQKAVNAGYNVDIVHSVLQSVTPLNLIKTEAIGGEQPEFTKPIWDYVNSTLHPTRVSSGKEKLAQNGVMFSGIEAKYAPPREILAAIWGMETSYGKILGNTDAVRQLAGLAYTGQRQIFAEKELLAVFTLIETGEVTREQLMKASWAGAFGQTQFMPSTFLAHARDGDGDGRKDVWSSSADALASAGNYLQVSGWKASEPWAIEASLPEGVNYALADGEKREWRIWRALGFGAMQNQIVSDDWKAELFLPAGQYGPAFFLFDNFYVIKTYNNADSYALSIGLLADKLAGRPDLSKQWPTDLKLLSKVDVEILQNGLNKLGYDAGGVDGLAGRKTRSALQSYQKDRDLPADGFPTHALLDRIRREANV